MKKILFLLPLALMLTACGPENQTENNNTNNGESQTQCNCEDNDKPEGEKPVDSGCDLTIEGFEYSNGIFSKKVDNNVSYLDFNSLLKVNSGSYCKLSYDVECRQEIYSRAISLSIGDNSVYALVYSNLNNFKFYIVNVRRLPIYKVTFNTNGGTSIPMQNVQEGSCICETSAPTKTGYTFDKWDYDFSEPVMSNLTINASYTMNSYNISFDCNGGKEIEPLTVKHKDKVTLPTPVRDGYTFTGWTLNGEPYSLNPESESTFTDDVELVATWEANDNEVTLYRGNLKGHVIFDYNDGRGIFKEYDVEERGDYIDFPYPDRVDKEFLGWSTTPQISWYGSTSNLYGCSGTRINDSSINTSTGASENSFRSLNQHFYAIWYESLYSGYNYLEMEYGLLTPQFTTYYFYIDGSYAIAKLTIEGNFDGNVYALEQEVRSEGQSPKYERVALLDSDKTYELDVTRIGSYWVAKQGSYYYNREFRITKVSGTKDIKDLGVTIKASRINAGSFNVIPTYEADYYYSNGYKRNVKTDQDYVLPYDNPDGLDFVGYFGEENGKGIKYTDNEGKSLKPWSDLAVNKLYAYYVPKKLNLSFVSGCEESFNDIEVEFMKPFELPIPNKTGYHFDGWYFGEQRVLESGLSWNDFLQNDSIQLVARWTALKFKISFSEKSSETKYKSGDYYYLDVSYDQDITLGTPATSKSGYEFMGWYTGENGTGTKLTNKSGRLLENWHFLTDLFVYPCFEPLT